MPKYTPSLALSRHVSQAVLFNFSKTLLQSFKNVFVCRRNTSLRYCDESFVCITIIVFSSQLLLCQTNDFLPFVHESMEGGACSIHRERKRKSCSVSLKSVFTGLVKFLVCQFGQTHSPKTLLQYLLKTAVLRTSDFHVLRWSSSLPPPNFLCKWYSPFKKVLVISQCSVSFQQSAAGSTFHRGSAGSITHTHTHSLTRTLLLRDTHTQACSHTDTLTPHVHPLFKAYTSSSRYTFPLSRMPLFKGKDKLL